MKYFFSLLLLTFLKNVSLCNVREHFGDVPKSLYIPSKLPFDMLDKRKNVIIYGIPASKQQTQKDTVNAVLEVLSLLDCDINPSDILLVKRLGCTLRKSVGVLVTFSAWPIKKMVYHRRHLLQGSPYSMELDFPKVISYRIRLLKPLRDKFIKRGKNASIIWGKLYVDGKHVPDNICQKYLFTSSTIPNKITES